MTSSEWLRDNSVMISSAIPSEKYSYSGLALMLVKANTAIEGLSGNGNVCGLVPRNHRACSTSVRSPSTASFDRIASTGRAIFFRSSAPSSSKARSSRSTHVITHCPRDADTARWTLSLKPCGDAPPRHHVKSVPSAIASPMSIPTRNRYGARQRRVAVIFFPGPAAASLMAQRTAPSDAFEHD